MIEKEFGKFIKSKRLELKLSLKDVGNCLGKSATYISDVENGNRYAYCKSDCYRLIELFKMNVPETIKFRDLAKLNWQGLVDEKMK